MRMLAMGSYGFKGFMLPTEVRAKDFGSRAPSSSLAGLARRAAVFEGNCTWVVVKILVFFWVLDMILHLVFRGPKRGPSF